MGGIITVTHAFVSAQEDSPDAVAAGEIVPSNWNDEHVVVGAAPIDSPDFINTPTAPTPPVGDRSTRLATTESLNEITQPARKTLTGAGDYVVLPGIGLVVVKKAVPALTTITLPLSTAANSPDVITIKDRMLAHGAGAGTFNITVNAAAGETLDGQPSVLINVDNEALSFSKVRDDSGNVTGEGWEICGGGQEGQATTSVHGIVELATDAEAEALADTQRAITPSNLAAVLALDVQAFSVPGIATWTKPNVGRFALIQVIASAGGGARRSVGNGAGGGCGPYYERLIPLSSLGATETVTIGAGGAVQLADNTNGNPGGPTSFGAWLTIYGGRGGENQALGIVATGGGSGGHADTWSAGGANFTGLIPGSAVNNNLGVVLNQAFLGASATGALASNAVQTVPVVAYNGGAGGSGHSTAGPSGGVQNTALNGGNGGAGNGAGAGGNGTSPGGGGGSGTTQGGSAGNGRIVVIVF